MGRSGNPYGDSGVAPGYSVLKRFRGRQRTKLPPSEGGLRRMDRARAEENHLTLKHILGFREHELRDENRFRIRNLLRRSTDDLR